MPSIKTTSCIGAIVVLIGVLFTGCNPSETISGLPPQDVYVWQRLWTPAVTASVQSNAAAFRTLVILSAEITLRDGEPRIVRPVVDFKVLRECGSPVALAFRINPFPGPFSATNKHAEQITRVLREQISATKRAGLEPTEVHVDFDCAESKLAGYALWLRAIREAVAPLPVVPTSLPSWLGKATFKKLVSECGSYILQVHSVAAPKHPSDVGRLTDPVKVREWVKRAARIGVPFRVALPTYTYLVAFDPNGDIRGLSAEGPSSQWPADSKLIRWEARPEELAALIADWTIKRPALLQGVIWYRMPVSSDLLNWRMTTLSKVMAGLEPKRQLSIETEGMDVRDIVLFNRGETDEPLPQQVDIEWDAARLVSADALAGYQIDPANQAKNRAIFTRETNAAVIRLPPGARRNIGWIRCDTPTHLRVSFGEAGAGQSGAAGTLHP